MAPLFSMVDDLTKPYSPHRAKRFFGGKPRMLSQGPTYFDDNLIGDSDSALEMLEALRRQIPLTRLFANAKCSRLVRDLAD